MVAQLQLTYNLSVCYFKVMINHDEVESETKEPEKRDGLYKPTHIM